MVYNEDYSDVIVRTELGPGTGDELYQTADGQWWHDWDGKIRTGQEVRKLRRPQLS